MNQLSAQQQAELRIRQRLANDYPFYAAQALKIRPKIGGTVPFVLNSMQLRSHRLIEGWLAERGYLRLWILKARQLGISTYIGGRYFQKTSHRRGIKAFIMTHEQRATDNLFAMVSRFYENLPPQLKPQTSTESAKELWFSRLDSGYSVGTAGVKETGRSDTIQLFHGSEVAFWPNAEIHAAGILSTIPRVEGTESILESTANGVGGFFYNGCMAAQKGIGEDKLLFLPWAENPEYSIEPPRDWAPAPEFDQYQQIHSLTDAQLYWAFVENTRMAAAVSADPEVIQSKFHQEFPMTVSEAFQAGGEDALIKPRFIVRARNTRISPSKDAARALGVDVARGGKDRTRLMSRRGRKAGEIDKKIHTNDLMIVVDHVVQAIRAFDPHVVYIDVTGLGAGVYDRLVQLGYDICVPVNFGGAASEPEKYLNKRVEMWARMNDWISEEALPVDIPDDDDLQGDLGCVKYHYDAKDRLVLPKKEEIKKEFGFSPDGGDALALTFAERFNPEAKKDRKLDYSNMNRGVV